MSAATETSLPAGSDTVGGVRVAVDVGGTFTDIVLIDETGAVGKAKVLSTPPDFEQGVIRGLRAVLSGHGVGGDGVQTLFHGMTVATNAVLEGRGSATALVTTRGFRDTLELGRGRRPDTYDMNWLKVNVLVPRRFRVEVNQRITADGDLAPPVDPAEASEIGRRLRDADVESIAVCLINSYVRPDEERRLAELLRAACPGVWVTASVDLDPEPGEYERTSTAVVNAYVAPIVDSYLGRLERELDGLGVHAPLYVMRSSGGLLRSGTARAEPVRLIESGPAAGVVGVRALARELGLDSVIAFDMGGTTAKATLIENGEAFETPQYEVGGAMNSGPGLGSGGGYPIRIASLDIAEIGAGGGSIFWVDAGGAPRVGPESAGASPGPACYGAGGTRPTLSDAKLLLGYLNPTAIAGGSQPLDADLAEQAMAPVADALGLSVLDVAYGAYEIAVAGMTRLMRAVTTERGRDPREATLVAFGGAGPAYVCAVARQLEIRRALVPPAPGLFSAVGLLVAEPQHELVRAHVDGALTVDTLSGLLDEMESEIVSGLVADGYEADRIRCERSAEMRYEGQTGTLRVGIPPGTMLGEPGLDGVLDRFEAEHERTYGHQKDRGSIRMPAIRVRAHVRNETDAGLLGVSHNLATDSGVAGSPGAVRDAYFGPSFGMLATRVLGRSDLTALPVAGPLIVEEMDSTIVITPDARASIDDHNDLVIELA
jgi:N-methylhydantoinase A